MRERKSRGKLTCIGQEGDGEWVYGHYCKIKGKHYIIPDYADCEWEEEAVWSVQGLLEVDPETVGDYAGVKDKNDVEIYEGDRVISGNGSVTEIVFGEHVNVDCCSEEEDWCRGIGFYFKDKFGHSNFGSPHKDANYEIIVSIHDKESK